jgi:hypothetical protein
MHATPLALVYIVCARYLARLVLATQVVHPVAMEHAFQVVMAVSALVAATEAVFRAAISGESAAVIKAALRVAMEVVGGHRAMAPAQQAATQAASSSATVTVRVVSVAAPAPEQAAILHVMT